MLQSPPFTSHVVLAFGWYVETTTMFEDPAVVVIVLVFPKSTGEFVTRVKSPDKVIPSRQIWVVDAVSHTCELFIGAGERCHTANVPVSDVLCVAMYALK